MDKFQVETVVGFTVRTAYLEEDWHTLAGMIRYPIIIKGTELNDADAFLEYMTDKSSVRALVMLCWKRISLTWSLTSRGY